MEPIIIVSFNYLNNGGFKKLLGSSKKQPFIFLNIRSIRTYSEPIGCIHINSIGMSKIIQI